MPRRSCTPIKRKGKFSHCRRRSARGRKCTPAKRGSKLYCRRTPKRQRSSTAKRRRTRKQSSALKEVQKYAKDYMAKHKGAKWQTAMKHGGVKYRQKHK